MFNLRKTQSSKDLRFPKQLDKSPRNNVAGRLGWFHTFLHSLEGVVGFDKFHRVGDFLTLQNVIVQTQV